jgi:hypothetical protein
MKPGTKINNTTATCLHRHAHKAHRWAYTSEGGGHMAELGWPDGYNDYKEWDCPGRTEAYDPAHNWPDHILIVNDEFWDTEWYEIEHPECIPEGYAVETDQSKGPVFQYSYYTCAVANMIERVGLETYYRHVDDEFEYGYGPERLQPGRYVLHYRERWTRSYWGEDDCEATISVERIDDGR